MENKFTVRVNARGTYDCPKCSYDATKLNTLQRHCIREHSVTATVVEQKTAENKQKNKRIYDKARYKQMKRAKNLTKLAMERQCFTIAQIKKRGAHGATKPLVKVAPSAIDGAGNGVFACENLIEGDCLTEYCGIHMDNEPGDSEYAIEMKTKDGKRYLDGLRVPENGKGVASFVNRATRKLKKWKNFDFKQVRNQMFLYATKSIKIDEELYVPYGRGYRFKATKK